MCRGGVDPVVLYDPDADRWLLSEIGTDANFLCVAVSQTPDPSPPAPYSTFTFDVRPMDPSGFSDYPKYVIWPDAYYVSTFDETTATNDAAAA